MYVSIYCKCKYTYVYRMYIFIIHKYYMFRLHTLIIVYKSGQIQAVLYCELRWRPAALTTHIKNMHTTYFFVLSLVTGPIIQCPHFPREPHAAIGKRAVNTRPSWGGSLSGFCNSWLPHTLKLYDLIIPTPEGRCPPHKSALVNDHTCTLAHVSQVALDECNCSQFTLCCWTPIRYPKKNNAKAAGHSAGLIISFSCHCHAHLRQWLWKAGSASLCLTHNTGCVATSSRTSLYCGDWIEVVPLV